jgi:hypothetical protein
MSIIGRGRDPNHVTIFINATHNTERNLHLTGQQIIFRYSYSNKFVVSATVM